MPYLKLYHGYVMDFDHGTVRARELLNDPSANSTFEVSFDLFWGQVFFIQKKRLDRNIVRCPGKKLLVCK